MEEELPEQQVLGLAIKLKRGYLYDRLPCVELIFQT